MRRLFHGRDFDGRAVRRMATTAASIVVILLTASNPVPAQQVVEPDVDAELTQVREVLESPGMQEAVEYVEGAEEETVREWLSLCNAYAPSYDQSLTAARGPDVSFGSEIYRSRLLYKLFRIYGLEDVHIDDALNVVGVRRGVGEGPTVVLHAHHDNVALWPKDQPVQAFVADGRVWCPAARDDLMGVTQLLTVLRAMNAGDVHTRGDVWFVSFTGEETGSRGAEHFVRANFPHNIDWRDGDIMIQFHGGGGEGVTTGSSPYIHTTQLRFFVPLDYERWRTDAVDALGPMIARVNREIRDPRSTEINQYEVGAGEMVSDLLYVNMGMVEGGAIPNGTSPEATLWFDLRSPTEERLWRAHEHIQALAEDVAADMGEGFTYKYEIIQKLGVEGIDGWDKVDNRPARVVAAAAEALYGVPPRIDPTRGCGDCRRAYGMGMPAISLWGNVVDRGDGDVRVRPDRGSLEGGVRRKTSGHDVTESAEIVNVWSGAKHGLLSAVAYAGLASPGGDGVGGR